jgi:2',3'-cyclic-nucleotide 2'-phosphodiesterase (5'-nucleotidase family)
MAIEIVDFPITNGGSFHSYVSLPEGKIIMGMIMRSLPSGYD